MKARIHLLAAVLGGAGILALLGFSARFLLTKIREDQNVTATLAEKTARFKALNNRAITPNKENVELARTELKKVRDFAAEAGRYLAAAELPGEMKNKDFRSLLDNTIAELQREAEKLAVALPAKDYWFTFQAQKPMVEFKPIGALAAELADVRDICGILFRARVHALTGLKRAPVAPEDAGYADFLADRKGSTNDLAIVRPYEVTFQGFSGELARVMEGFATAPRSFIVKAVNADKAPAPIAPSASPTEPPTRFFPPPNIRNGNILGFPRSAGSAPAKTAPRGPTTVLEESKLKFTLLIDSVSLKPAAKK